MLGHAITAGASLQLVLETAMITYHYQVVSLGARKLVGSYSPGSDGTYHYRFKSPPRNDTSLLVQATSPSDI